MGAVLGSACAAPTAKKTVLGDREALKQFGYEGESVLGEGAFGQVLLVSLEKPRRQYACKKLKQEQVESSWLQTEVTILKTCRHPNITFLREVCVSKSNEQVFLILELARGGSLLERIEAEKRLTESHAASVVIQIASALAYLHGKGIVHRDMKPENVLLLENTSRSLVKLCDFGLSKITKRRSDTVDQVAQPMAGQPGQPPLPQMQRQSSGGGSTASFRTLMKSRVGSHYYVSPEVLLEEEYTAAVDLWGLGHILYQSLTGVHAFDESVDMYSDVIEARVDYGDRAWREAPEVRVESPST